MVGLLVWLQHLRYACNVLQDSLLKTASERKTGLGCADPLVSQGHQDYKQLCSPGKHNGILICHLKFSSYLHFLQN